MLDTEKKQDDTRLHTEYEQWNKMREIDVLGVDTIISDINTIRAKIINDIQTFSKKEQSQFLVSTLTYHVGYLRQGMPNISKKELIDAILPYYA